MLNAQFSVQASSVEETCALQCCSHGEEAFNRRRSRAACTIARLAGTILSNYGSAGMESQGGILESRCASVESLLGFCNRKTDWWINPPQLCNRRKQIGFIPGRWKTAVSHQKGALHKK
jgi:hypothetical protein